MQSPELAVDTSNNAYLTGVTSSTRFSLRERPSRELQSRLTLKQPHSSRESTRQRPPPRHPSYSTYLEGSTLDAASAIALGPNNVAYVTGSTNSLDFPTTTGAFQTTGAAAGVAFITLVDTTMSGSAVGDIFNILRRHRKRHRFRHRRGWKRQCICRRQHTARPISRLLHSPYRPHCPIRLAVPSS